jgi:CotH protein/putative metal-binding protein
LLFLVPAVVAACAVGERLPLGAGSGGNPDDAPGTGGMSAAAISGSAGRGAGPSGAVGGGAAVGGPGSGGAGGALPALPCADLFADDLLVTYEITVAPRDWDALVLDFNNAQQNRAANLNFHPYHPVLEFRYGNEVVTNAMIRLKGNSSWWQAIGDARPKMQFVISFNQIDANARFHGLRKIELDMPRIDPTFLHQRISLAFLRALGLPAQCANSARVVINGAYYGLFTNLERPDKEFLERLFPGADQGDLWDGGWELQTNEETMSLPHPRMDALWAAKDTKALAAITDMDEALLEWAGESMLADPDGYWIGHWNFFLYDHPRRGWLWVPHDLDVSINWTDPSIDPMYYWGGDPGWSPPWQHYLAVIKDPVWQGRYVEALRRANDTWSALHLPEMLDHYAAQIRDAVAADPTFPFTFDDHLRELANLRQAIITRGAAVRAWLDCRAAPGDAIDADGDRRPFCMDCNDKDPATYPGAPEICRDNRDQDCDGTDWTGC